MVFWEGIICVFLFYCIIFAIGIWAACKRKKLNDSGLESDDLMLAGRDIGLVVGFFTMTATWVGGGYINGTAEVVYNPALGLVWCQAPIFYALSLIFGGIFFAGKMRSQGYVTMLDPFQKKFGQRMGGLLFIPALMGEVCWSAAVLSALGSTISVIIGGKDTLAIIISTAIIIIYTMFGGLYSVAYTDVIQLLFIFIGLWLSIPFAMNNKHVTSISRTSTRWLGSRVPNDQILIYVDTALMLTLGGIPWQVYFQRVLSARTTKRAQYLSFIAAIGCLIMAIPAVLIGAIGASTDWNATGFTEIVNGTLKTEDFKKVLPLVMRWVCPTWVAFFGLGAISAAVMSSADSSILSASSMFSRNIVKCIFWQSASDKHITWIMKISTFVFGSLSCTIGIFVTSIYSLWALCSDLVYAVVFPQLFCVIYISKSNTYGSLCGYITGLFFRFTAGEQSISLPAVIKYPYYKEDTKEQLFPYKTFSMIVSIVFIIVISLLTDYLFKSGKLSKEKDVFRCVINLKDPVTDLGETIAGASNVPMKEPPFKFPKDVSQNNQDKVLTEVSKTKRASVRPVTSSTKSN